MKNIIQDLQACIEENPVKLKEMPDYLDLRGGKFNCKVGFSLTNDPVYAKPSIIIDNSLEPDYNICSSAVFS